MNIIARLWRKLLFLFITGSTTLVVAACYGTPAGIRILNDWTIRVRDQNDDPIPGLKVTIFQYVDDAVTPRILSVESTDALGNMSTVLTSDYDYTTYRHEVLIEDIDGEANGGTFPDTQIARDGKEETIVRLQAAQ